MAGIVLLFLAIRVLMSMSRLLYSLPRHAAWFGDLTSQALFISSFIQFSLGLPTRIWLACLGSARVLAKEIWCWGVLAFPGRTCPSNVCLLLASMPDNGSIFD